MREIQHYISNTLQDVSGVKDIVTYLQYGLIAFFGYWIYKVVNNGVRNNILRDIRSELKYMNEDKLNDIKTELKILNGKK